MGASRKLPTPFPLPEDLTGFKIGRFLIRSRLGAGGMGQVYYADDTKLRRPVALKRVARKLANDVRARRRILLEAQRASALSSEYIASVHDVVEQGDELFLVMEYVQGETLRQRLRQAMSLEQFFQIATQCAEALAEAHEHGIIHCDIKPENIMVTPAGHVKILDFGLAKHLPSSDQSSTLEYFAGIEGTPAYMAPEVLLEELPDARTDIFSLGVVLYEMLTQRHPFHSSSFVATSERILHATPAAIRAFNPAVPEGLTAVVLKAMAKAPGERYASSRELLNDLVQAQAGASPKPAPGVAQRESWTSKRWVLGATAAMAVLAVIFAFRDWKPHSQPVLAERGWVLISDVDTSGEGGIPDKAVREALTMALQQSQYVNVLPRARAYEVLQRMKKADTPRIDELVGREICQRENLQVLLATSIERMGQVFQITVRALDPGQGDLLFAERERFGQQDQFFEKTDELVRRIRRDFGESTERIEKNSRPLARVTTPSLKALQLYSQAKDAHDQGKDAEVKSLLQAALQLDPDFAMAHLQLGQYYSGVGGKNANSVKELEAAYRLREGVSEREQRRIEAGYYALQERYEEEAQSLSMLVSLYPDDEEAHEELASAYNDVGRLDKAVVELREVLRLNPNSAPAYRRLVLYLAQSGQPDTAISVSREAQQRGVEPPQMHWGVGLAYLIKDDAPRARQEFERIGHGTEVDRELQELYLAVADLYEGKLQAAKQSLAKQIEDMARNRGGLQTVRRYLLGRIGLSQGSFREATVEADRILRVPSSDLQVYDLLNAGILYTRTGKMDQARQVLRRIDDSRKSVPSSWNQSCFHNLEGEIALAAGKPEAAESSFQSGLEDYPQAFSHAGLARAYQSQKRWGEAAQEWERVLQRKGEILQSDFPPELANAHLELARVYREMNKLDLARNHYEEVLRMWRHADTLRLVNDANRELGELLLELTPRKTTQIFAPRALP